MSLRKSISSIFVIALLSVTGLASFVLSAASIANCQASDNICIDLPEIISGSVTQTGYFSGTIDVASKFTVSNLFENLTAEYSLDNWVTSSSAAIQHNVFLNIPVDHPNPVYSGNEIVVAGFSDGGFVAAWLNSETSIAVRGYSSDGDSDVTYSTIHISPPQTKAAYLQVLTLPNDDWVLMWVESLPGANYVADYITVLNYKVFNRRGVVQYSGEITDIQTSYSAYDLVPSADGFYLALVSFTGVGAAGTGIVLYDITQSLPSGKELGRYTKSNHLRAIWLHRLSNGNLLLSDYIPYHYIVVNGERIYSGEIASRVLSPSGDLLETLPVLTDVGSMVAANDEDGNYVRVWANISDWSVKASVHTPDGTALGVPFNITPPDAYTTDTDYGYMGIGYVGNSQYLISSYNDNTKSLNIYIVEINGALHSEPRLLSSIATSGYISRLHVINQENLVIATNNAVTYVPYIKSVSTGSLTPGVDFNITPGDSISAEFRIADSSNAKWYSGVRNYIYGSTDDGSGISMDYPAGFTNADEVLVNIPDTIPNTNPPDPVCITCSIFEVYQREVAVQNGSCTMPTDPLLGWSASPVAAYSALPVNDGQIAVTDGYCYQFKVATTNMNGNGDRHEYINPNVVWVDRTSPTIIYVSENVVWDSATLELTFQDNNSGVNQDTARYQINNGAFVSFNGTVALVPGANFVRVEVEDNAGNVGTYSHTFFFDNTPPDIVIHTIEDGGTYGADVTLDFSLTQQLSNLTILVDGIPRSDLVGLPDGVHTIVISGYDAQGNLVQKTVSFTKDSTIFSVTILSPYSGSYDVNDIIIDYTASKPVSSATYTLDGVNGSEVTNGMVLTDIADGNHLLSLVFTPMVGTPVTKDIQFTVKNGIPVLNVFAPTEGAVYPENKFVAEFTSDLSSTVSYQIAVQGEVLSDPVPITSGTEVTVPSDGSYTLTLTATHSNSGNQLSQMVHFSTDALQPAITLASPHTGLYTFDTVPINFTTNKPLSGVEYFLDGNSVTELVGLTTGPHTFRVQAKDSANRVTQQIVQFNVATLDILTPQNGETVISNTMPPELPFRYSTTGGFTSFTAAVDSGPRQLLVDPPGATIPLPVSPGDHEVTLRGQVYGLTAAKRANFTIGAMNLNVGKGSISYTYANCDAVTSICDVTASVRVTNNGDYAVNQQISVRFDHIAAAGYQTQWQTIAGLPTGQSAEVTFAPFQATLGDTFAAFVDPNSEIVGEWTADNAYSLAFQTGQITAVTQNLAQENVYLEGVSIFNPMIIDTAGAIASVEVVVNGWTFIDSNGANGFNLMADMGLLTDTSECVQVIARSTAAVALDSQNVCFDVRTINPDPVAKFAFPWDAYSQGNGIIDVSALSLPDVAATLSSLRAQTIKQPSAILPVLAGNDGVVEYKYLHDPAALIGQPYVHNVDMGNTIFSRDVFNGHAIYISELNLTHGVCDAPSAIPIASNPNHMDVGRLLEDEMAAINPLANVDITALLSESDELSFLELWSGGGFLYYSDILSFGGDEPNVFEKVINLAAISPSIYLFTDGWEELRVDVAEKLNIDYGFTGAGCFILDTPQGMSLAYDGEFAVNIDSLTEITTSGMDVDMFGAMTFSVLGVVPLDEIIKSIWGTQFATATVVVGGVTVYPQTINLHVGLGYGAQVDILNEHLYVAPVVSNFETSIDYDNKLAKADLALYPIYFYGFGFGTDWKAYLHLHGFGEYDLVGGGSVETGDYDTQEFKYAEFDGKMDEYVRYKVCYIGVCIHGNWGHDKTTILDDEENGPSITGVKYTADEVAAALDNYGRIDVGEINDLTTLGLYFMIHGDSQLAQEYLSCGIMENLFTSSMPFAPLYSTRSGSCTPVTEPDFEPAADSLYFTDATCTNEIDYKATSFLNYCQNNLLADTAKEYIGNAAAWLDEESSNPAYSGIGKNSKWTLSHGAALDMLSLSPAGNHRPYVKQVEYRTVDSCSLEMRVYKKDIAGTNLKPLMLLHGGAWKYRGFGAAGADSLISHLTDRGFIVFKPYYRLMGNSDGPAECGIPFANTANDPAPGEFIVQDMDAALTWVETHGPTLGSTGGQVTLVGQSAGAHLSGWLASHRSSEIAKNLLIYPPIDLPYYIEQVVNGTYGIPPVHDAVSILNGFFGADITTMDPANFPTFVAENGFPDAVRNGVDFPPTFMIHGNADKLVPAYMSTRMCDALADVPDSPPYSTAGGRYTCGDSRGTTNVMHIIDGADHVLDMKCFVDTSSIGAELVEAFGDVDLSSLCPSGSQATSDNIVRPALIDAVNWLAAP